MTTHMPRTMFEKIWSRHQIMARADGQVLLYIDRHLVQDGAAPALEMLRQRGIAPHAPARTFATPPCREPPDRVPARAFRDAGAAELEHDPGRIRIQHR